MAEDKIKTSATKNAPGLQAPSREETQGSLDLLSLALAQTSRDPNLMATVQMNIEKRMQAAREAEIEAMRQIGENQRTAMTEQGAESRSQRASRTQLASTQMAQEGQMQRAQLEDATRRAIAGLESRDKALDRDLERQKIDRENMNKRIERVQPIMKEAQDALVRLTTSGGKDDPFTQMIVASASGLVGKEKLSDEEQRTVAMAGALSSGGPVDFDQALDITTNIMSARMRALPPEDQALAAEGLRAWAENFRLLDRGTQSPQDAVNAIVAIAPMMLSDQAVGPVQRFAIQNRLASAWSVIENDDAARGAAMEGVRNAVLQMGEFENDEEKLYALFQINQVIADGIQFDDFSQLQRILKDVGVMTETPPSWLQRSWQNVRNTPEAQERRAARKAKQEE